MSDTKAYSYTERLQSLEQVWWKRLFDVQAPYRWNVRRLEMGYTLDVGCGIGRNLMHLSGNGIGVDHNPSSVQIARDRGLKAYTTAEFFNLDREYKFDSILMAHLLEHMSFKDRISLVSRYLPYLAEGGKVVIITPQEAGYASDETHVEFVGFNELDMLCRELSLTKRKSFSFPFPRFMGKFFKHNEFVYIAQK